MPDLTDGDRVVGHPGTTVSLDFGAGTLPVSSAVLTGGVTVDRS